MRPVIRKDRDAVSEVIGTILILAMTVVLFAVIIVWVSSIPTPQASIRLEMNGVLTPIYDAGGSWNGVNVTVTHRGGESLPYTPTRIYLQVERAGSFNTEILWTVGTVAYGPNSGTYYGLIDGTDDTWNINERWTITNYTVLPADTIKVTVVDTFRSLVLWSETIQGPLGVHPPLIVEKWTDRIPATITSDRLQTGSRFTVYAKVIDQDGDLLNDSVHATFTIFYGIPDFRKDPQRMYDDGATYEDRVASDGIYTFTADWLVPGITWDGSIVLFNATDAQGHTTTSRMTLSVVPGPPGSQGGGGFIGSGRPPNLNYNGLQGYNIFNATEWDQEGYNATETRTFRGSETVVVVVGSKILTDSSSDVNDFLMYDPYSGIPADAVIYGTTKVLSSTSKASRSPDAFTFFDYVNGYNVFTYRFQLNNASTLGGLCPAGKCFQRTPTHPPNYYFARYPAEILIEDTQGNRFHTTDTINITDEDGWIRDFPRLETFRSSGFTEIANTFNYTDVVYARITMATVDGDITNVAIGNVIIQDFQGGTQVWKAPLDGYKANPPICHPSGSCTGIAVEIHGASVSYRFAINLSRADQDPWVPGSQHYALRVASVIDSDEEYTLALSRQLIIKAPLYKLDIAIANDDTSDNAWGTHDQAYYFENINSWDRWRKIRVHVGDPPPAHEEGRAIKYLDFDQDGDLDLAVSIKVSNAEAWLIVYRRDLDSNGNTVWTRFRIENTGSVVINDIATGSLNKDGFPEIVVGRSDGQLRYYRNDGSWTPVTVDTIGAEIKAVDLGDFDGDGDTDIVVARTGGTIEYYLNLDGQGKFTTTGQTDQWYAEAENIQKGTILSGTYQNTFSDDDVFEVLREAQLYQPATWINRTANADFSTGPGQITSGSYVTTQTQDDAWEQITETTTSGTRQALTHKWTMSLPTSGTKTFYLDAHRNVGADDTFTFAYSTDDVTYTTLVIVTATSDTDSYLTASIPGTVSGTVYIRVTDSQQTNGESTDSIRVDHMYVETFYAAGDVSALEHYWRMQTLPSRGGSTFTFYVRALRDDTGGEGDNFQFAYSTGGQFGTYTDMVGALVNQGTEALYSSTLPNLGGQVVWVRVVDTDRTAGRTQLATLSVDRMYIEVVTTGGVTGSEIVLPDGADATALDVDDQDSDGFADVVVGTSASHVYKVKGSSGGLQSPSSAFYTTAGAVVGVKFAETLAGNGLEILAATASTVYVIRADQPTGTLITTLSSANPITAFGAGDVNGDGWDDIVWGTGANNVGEVVYYVNRITGWATPTPLPPGFSIGKKIFDLDLGDADNSQYLGR